ncbi:MAG TPA: helix-turn-helix domain-containing protein [Baekduia sp.]|uniref:helix-turn-helix domain-containing protein n=1 Tax=Baekduia sp. TaxID=2600305 RepID=UPI002C396EEA|nr:helix-turn-helix domain-containing protein [Baekduia sp.]HMJ36263.1 helix-turn-helix domain-containing protein [Baekduia sp.]
MATRSEQEQRRKTLRPHPARDQIVDAMRSYGRPISPTRLAEVTGGSIGSVAYHVRTLLKAGVVELAEEGRVRGAIEHFYALVPASAADLNDPLIGLQRLCGALTVPDAAGGYPQPIALDDPARAQLHKLLDTLRPKVQRIVRDTAKRAAATSARAAESAVET